jgi:hypothetical protein
MIKINYLTSRKRNKCLKSYAIFAKIQNALIIAKDSVRELFMLNVEKKWNNKQSLAFKK